MSKELTTSSELQIIIENQDTVALDKLLQNGSVNLTAALTGFFMTDNSSKVGVAGRIVQAVLKGKFLKQLGQEFEELRQKGKIKENLFENENRIASLLEMLQYIDSELTDQEVFNAMKSIFFASLDQHASEKDEIAAYQILKVCRKLSSGELLVLKVCFERIGYLKSNAVYGAGQWLSEVGTSLGFATELVETFEETLIQKKLLSDRAHSDRSGIKSSENYRLSGLGIQLKEFLDRYESLKIKD